MSTNEISLSERTYAQAQRLAAAKNVSVEELVSEAIERYSIPPRHRSQTELIGAFSDCADLWDGIVEEAYKNRERYPLRAKPE